MLRLLGLAFGLLWVFVGWRNLPPLDNRSAWAAGLAIGVTCWLSWWAGKSMTGARAMAVATARAEAHAASLAQSRSSSQAVGNVFVMSGAASLHERVPRPVEGLDAVEWIGAPKPLMEQDVIESMRDELREDDNATAEYEAG